MAAQIGWYLGLERELSSGDMWALLQLIGKHYEVVIVDQQVGSDMLAKRITQYTNLEIKDKVEQYQANGLLYVVCYNGAHATPADKVTFIINPDGHIGLIFDDGVAGARRKSLASCLAEELEGKVGRWNE